MLTINQFKFLDLEYKVELLEKRVKELEDKLSKQNSTATNIYTTISDKLDSKELASKIIETLNKYNQEVKVSNNELRKKVIKEAKELLNKHLDEQQFMMINVNKSHGLVICTVIDEQTGNVASGKYQIPINKCYNEYIAQAIAISKALGLDYKKFEKIAEPDKVVVGHKLNWTISDSKFRVKNIDGDRYNFHSYQMNGETGYLSYNKLENYCTIINDTNAEY